MRTIVIMAVGVLLIINWCFAAGVTTIESLPMVPRDMDWMENSNMNYCYGFGAGYTFYLKTADGTAVRDKPVSLSVLSHTNDDAFTYINGDKVYGRDVFDRIGWQAQDNRGRTRTDGTLAVGVGYGNSGVFLRHCNYSSSPCCDPPLPDGTEPITTQLGEGRYFYSLLKVKGTFKKLGKTVSSTGSIILQYIVGQYANECYWYDAESYTDESDTETASANSVAVLNESSISIIDMNSVTLSAEVSSTASASSSDENTVTGPPQSYALPTTISGNWYQWSDSAYIAVTCLVPESFDGIEGNKPYSTVDLCGPYVYITTLPTTADNQSLLLYSRADNNDCVCSTRIVMHKIAEPNWFVSDYIVPTDEPNYAGTITGESSQIYRCVFVEENGHLTIGPDEIYGDFDRNGIVDLNDFGYFGCFWGLSAADDGYQIFLDYDLDGIISYDNLAEWCSNYLNTPPKHIVNFMDYARESRLGTIDSIQPFFERYLKDKFAP